MSVGEVVARLGGASAGPPVRPPGSAADGLADGNRTASPMDAVEALAAILEPEAFDPDQPADEGWREATKQRAIAHAARVITSGWVRVVEDDDTIDLLADLLWTRLNPRGRRWSELLGGASEAEFRDHARAVVRALREGQ